MSSEIKDLIRQVVEGQESIFDLSKSTDDVKRIEITRQQLPAPIPQQMPEAAVARAKARSHVFNDVEAFSDYLNRWADKDASVVLADVESQKIVAVLNEDDPQDREIITLEAIEHPLFTPWAALLEKPIPVIQFALFIMQNRRAVLTPDGRELAMVFSQVKMSKAITMHTGVGKKSLNGVIVDVEIAGEKKGVPVELPETIKIQAPLFVGTSPQAIEIDLLVTNQAESVVVYCTAADVEEQRIMAFEEMVAKIKEATGQLVGLGQIAHRDWATVPFAK
jgi:hypothetical protein